MQDQGAAPSQKLEPSLNPPPKPPSKAYDEATKSPVHRLSELMFGSLLASYVLGFVSFLAPHAVGLVTTPGKELLVSLPYLFISFTFAYVTAGLYLSYTAGILTMHHMTLKHLRSDFLLALSQAIAFGISMVFPMTTAICLGLVLSGALLRQWQEHNGLIQSFYDICVKEIKVSKLRGKKEKVAESREEFKLRFNNALKKYGTLSVWRGVQWYSYAVTVGLLALGGSLCYAAWWRKFGAGWTLGVTCLIALGTFFYVHRILNERATFLDEDESLEPLTADAKPLTADAKPLTADAKPDSKPTIIMDREFKELLEELKRYYE